MTDSVRDLKPNECIIRTEHGYTICRIENYHITTGTMEITSIDSVTREYTRIGSPTISMDGRILEQISRFDPPIELSVPPNRKTHTAPGPINRAAAVIFDD